MGVITLLRQTVASMPAIAANKTALAIDSATGQLVLKDENGKTVLIPGVPGGLTPGGLAALVTTPSTITGAETVVQNGSLPANSLQVGTTLHVVAYGTLSAAAAGTILPKLRLGTAGTTADTQVAATTAAGLEVAAVGWMVEGFVTVRTIGSGGTAIGNLEVAVDSSAATYAVATQLSAQTATITVNTTVANFLDLTLTAGGTTPVITVVQSIIEVVKA